MKYLPQSGDHDKVRKAAPLYISTVDIHWNREKDAHDVGYDVAFTGVRWHTADVDDAVCCVEQHAFDFRSADVDADASL